MGIGIRGNAMPRDEDPAKLNKLHAVSRLLAVGRSDEPIYPAAIRQRHVCPYGEWAD